MDEHRHIRAALEELERLTSQLATGQGRREENLKAMSEIGARLVAAEPHHEREEKVLFPELTARGVEGPPSVMTEEHVALRRMKKTVRDEAARLASEASASTKALEGVAKELVFQLRNHIFKENNVLYPMALGVIRDDACWGKMRSASDDVGYCCHSPES